MVWPYLPRPAPRRRPIYKGCDLALTFYPGAAEAYDRAIAADPHFALAHAAKAQMLARQSNVAAARKSLGAAKEMIPASAPKRAASHIAFSSSSSRAGPTTRSPPCTRT